MNDLFGVEVKYKEEDKPSLLVRSLSLSFKRCWTTLVFGKETLQFEELVQEIFFHVKMNKSMGADMKNEGLLIKG